MIDLTKTLSTGIKSSWNEMNQLLGQRVFYIHPEISRLFEEPIGQIEKNGNLVQSYILTSEEVSRFGLNLLGHKRESDPRKFDIAQMDLQKRDSVPVYYLSRSVKFQERIDVWIKECKLIPFSFRLGGSLVPLQPVADYQGFKIIGPLYDDLEHRGCKDDTKNYLLSKFICLGMKLDE